MPNLNLIKEGPGGFNEYIDERAEAVVNAAIAPVSCSFSFNADGTLNTAEYSTGALFEYTWEAGRLASQTRSKTGRPTTTIDFTRNLAGQTLETEVVSS